VHEFLALSQVKTYTHTSQAMWFSCTAMEGTCLINTHCFWGG